MAPGDRVGGWIVLADAGRNENRHRCWAVRCDCETETRVEARMLRAGKSQRCRSCSVRIAAKKRAASFQMSQFEPGRAVADGVRCACGLLAPCFGCGRGEADAGLGGWSWV